MQYLVLLSRIWKINARRVYDIEDVDEASFRNKILEILMEMSIGLKVSPLINLMCDHSSISVKMNIVFARLAIK